MSELTRKVYGSYSPEDGKVSEFWFNLFCAAVAAEREAELYEMVAGDIKRRAFPETQKRKTEYPR